MGAARVRLEAEIARRIFREFAAGASPEAIVKSLNKESIAGPSGRAWSNTTLRGQADRGTGLLNNALYRGVLEWNRCSYARTRAPVDGSPAPTRRKMGDPGGPASANH